jgi:hypothetical protein
MNAVQSDWQSSRLVFVRGRWSRLRVSVVVMRRIEATHLEDSAHRYARTRNAVAVHGLSVDPVRSKQGQAHIAISRYRGSALRSADGSDLTQRLVQGPVARAARREPSQRGGSDPEAGSARENKKLVKFVGSPTSLTAIASFPGKTARRSPPSSDKKRIRIGELAVAT